MTAIRLTVNGRDITAEVAPRTHLADFLREHLLLTGTHLGCEHGVCGACTVLLDGAPARACITYPAAAAPCDVSTIEGLEDDPVMVRLRAAFTAEHALQCGYCTPGMLITAHDIVRRLPNADEDTIRLELAGNLCRCTGYSGIVRAIAVVLAAHEAAPPTPTAIPAAQFAAPAAVAAPPVLPSGPLLSQTLHLAVPADAVWQAIQDPALVAGCVPGAVLRSAEGGRLEGELVASLGPIRAQFTGQATLTFDAPARAGRIVGAGRDRGGFTHLTAEAAFRVVSAGPAATTIELDITYALRGKLAQFGRGPVIRVFAAEIAAEVASRLQARLTGEAVPARPSLARVVLRWLRRRLAHARRRDR